MPCFTVSFLDPESTVFVCLFIYLDLRDVWTIWFQILLSIIPLQKFLIIYKSTIMKGQKNPNDLTIHLNYHLLAFVTSFYCVYWLIHKFADILLYLMETSFHPLVTDIISANVLIWKSSLGYLCISFMMKFLKHLNMF